MKERVKLSDQLFEEDKGYYLSQNSRHREYKGKLSYRTAELGELLDQNSERSGSDIVLRFVIRRHQETRALEVLWGKEGGVGESFPAHAVLAFGTESSDQDFYSCVSAGNAHFDPKTQELLLINNKSGDFKPGFASLGYAIAAMQCSNIKFAPNFCLQKMSLSLAREMEEKIQLTEIQNKLPEVKINDDFPTLYGNVSPEEFKAADQAISQIEGKLKAHDFVLNGGGKRIAICPEKEVSKGTRDVSVAIRNFRNNRDYKEFVNAVETAISNKIKPTAWGIFNCFGGRDKATAELYKFILQQMLPLKSLIAKSATPALAF